MSDERVVIEFDSEGIPETRAEIDSLQRLSIDGFDDLNSAFELFQTALAGVQTVAGALYSSLIDSNERLNAELLKSQTALASNLQIYREGEEIVDITEKITSTQELLRESLKQIEIDTRDLVGVTTDQVNGVFQVLLQNSQAFIGQSKEFSNPIEAATASTKNWAAALGTLGLPLEQANQEIRSILTGDVNNPDSVIAKTLNISREQYDQWVANGELIDQLNAKLEVYAAGNALAAKSIAGVTSNIQSLFEDTARLVGSPLLEPIVDTLNDVYNILNANLDLFEELAGDTVVDLVRLIETLRNEAREMADALNFSPEGFLEGGQELISNLIFASEQLITLGSSLVQLVGDDLSLAFENVGTVANLTLEGIGKLAQLLTIVTDGIDRFLGSLGRIPGLNLGEVLGNAQGAVARLTGEFQQSVEAVQIYTDVTDVLLAQSEKLVNSQNATSDSIAGQIEQLETQREELKQVKTFREEDAKAIEGQITKIDEAIESLQGWQAENAELSFTARELQEVGSIYDSLAAKAEAAKRQIATEAAGDPQLFKDSVDALTELTEKQIEYGQITIDEARQRLNTILDNNKVEIEQREAALDTLKTLESNFTDFKIGQLELEAQAIALRTQTGELDQRQGLEQQFANENQQLQLQIELLDRQIERSGELGIESQALTQERQQLIQQQLEAEIGYQADVVALQEEAAQRAYDNTLQAAEDAEAARTETLTRGLLDRSVSESEFQRQQLQLTTDRLQAEFEAEQSNIARLEQLLTEAVTQDQRVDLQEQLDDARRNSQQINQQLLDNELATQESIQQAQLETIAKTGEAQELRFSQQELALRQSLENETEYQQALAQLNLERIEAQIAAELESQALLEEFGDTQGVQDSIARQIELQQSLLDAQEELQRQQTEAVLEGVEERLEAVDDAQQQQRLIIAQTVDDDAEAQAQLLQLTIDRIQAELAAERQAQVELAALQDTEGVEESLRRETELRIQLIEAEKAAEAAKADAVRSSIANQQQALADQFTTRQLQLRQSTQNEAEYQAGLAELAVDRIQAEIAASRQAEAELRAIGDTEGAAEEERQRREMAISLIEAEIDAEKALQAVIDDQLAKLEERLRLTQARTESGLLAEELRLTEAVQQGVVSKEEAELAKLDITRRRVDAEIRVLEQLQGQGDTETQIANQNRLTAAKLESLEISGQINDTIKDQQVQATLKAIEESYSKRVASGQEELAQLEQANQLWELQQESVARVGELRDAQADLATAQINTLTAGLDNEQRLVSASLDARRNLADVERQLAEDTELSEEQKTQLLAEQKALKAQLAVLGVEGQKSEQELLVQQMRIEQEQLAAKQAQLDIDNANRQLELESQRAAIQLDTIRAQNKAQEVALEAQLLQIKADQLRAEAQLTEDTARRNALLQQASAIDSQAARTLELSEAQTQAAEEEAQIKSEILDRQEAISDLQAEQAQAALDTEQTLLDAQQAYEASIQGISPSINVKPLDDFAKKMEAVKRDFNEMVNPKVPSAIKIPLNVEPANLSVTVKDNQVTQSISRLDSTVKTIPGAVSKVNTNLNSLGVKLDTLKRSVESSATQGGSGTTSVKPVINNNITVTVDSNGNASVDTQALLDERGAEARCQC